MLYSCFANGKFRSLFQGLFCSVVISSALVPAGSRAADEKTPTPPSSPQPPLAPTPGVVSNHPDQDLLGPGSIGPPTTTPPSNDWKEAQRQRNEKALVPGMGPGPMPTDTGRLEMLQTRMRELQEQQAQVMHEYQDAMAAAQKMPGAMQSAFSGSNKNELQKQLAMAQAQIAELAQRQERIMMPPLPPNAVLRAFKLQYVKPEEIGQALHNITGGGGPRVAIDQRTNALLIAGDDKQMGVVQQLVETLDQPGQDQKGKAAETLQLRVVWLLDGLPAGEGRPAEPPFVSRQVHDAIRELGFATPRVVCQQLTTLTLGKDNQRGQFNFRVPVLIQGSPLHFSGEGQIIRADDDRYTIELNLDVQQPDTSNRCELGGSILTPLAHYTVMGTSTFVTATAVPAGSAGAPSHEQRLSAFVVYLDRSRSFSEKEPLQERQLDRSR